MIGTLITAIFKGLFSLGLVGMLAASAVIIGDLIWGNPDLFTQDEIQTYTTFRTITLYSIIVPGIVALWNIVIILVYIFAPGVLEGFTTAKNVASGLGIGKILQTIVEVISIIASLLVAVVAVYWSITFSAIAGTLACYYNLPSCQVTSSSEVTGVGCNTRLESNANWVESTVSATSYTGTCVEGYTGTPTRLCTAEGWGPITNGCVKTVRVKQEDLKVPIDTLTTTSSALQWFLAIPIIVIIMSIASLVKLYPPKLKPIPQAPQQVQGVPYPLPPQGFQNSVTQFADRIGGGLNNKLAQLQ